VKTTPDDCFHLTVEIVCEIHDEAVKIFGGLHGIRDEALLASAVFAPQSSFGGRSPYVDVIDISAAYLFYLCRNHPFLDGNKRTAMAAAIVFLRLNGFDAAADSEKWEELVLHVASSKIDREQTTRRLRRLARIFHIRSAGSRAAPSKRTSSSTF
jgi:death-on-curing protein